MRLKKTKLNYHLLYLFYNSFNGSKCLFFVFINEVKVLLPEHPVNNGNKLVL
jgi:hypothetical protein